MRIIAIQQADFDLAADHAAMTAGRTDIGAIASFLGVVRDSAGGQPITAMTLEHYPGMTERALARIADDATSRWNLQACIVRHRVGVLRPGDSIVLVLAAAPHRQAALDATAYLIDWLKTRAPFWKKERFADGREAWVDAREADDAAVARWS